MNIEQSSEKPASVSNGLRFGILMNETGLMKWQARCVELLQDAGHTPVLIIINKNTDERLSGFARLKNYPWRNLIFRIHQRFFFKLPASEIVQFAALNDVEKIFCSPVKKGYSEYFPVETLKEISRKQPDFLLRFGFNIIRGEVLKVVRYGIWSFHHDDEQKYRGGPPAFWEIFHNDPINAVILQRLTEKLDAGIVLKKAWFKSINHSWQTSLNRVLMEAAHLPAQAANEFFQNKSPGSPDAVSTHAPIFRFPENRKMLRFLILVFWNKLKFHFEELFMAEKWNIGILNAMQSEIFEAPEKFEPVWSPEPLSGKYYADAFVLSLNGYQHLFFENYDYKTGLGELSRFVFEDLKIKNASTNVALKKDYHLAYPFSFSHNDNFYLIPESANNHSIDLYSFDAATGTLNFDCNLLTGVDAVDTTLLYYENKFWLFFTTKSLSDTHLFIYFSDALKGNYRPHVQNPVKSDCRNSRPAGNFFTSNDKLYRPAQDCSQTYGGAVVINEIEELTEKDFSERRVKILPPFKNSAYKKGFHTFASIGNYTSVDGKKYIFNFWQFIRILRRKF
jgi:hypothetical protein